MTSLLDLIECNTESNANIEDDIPNLLRLSPYYDTDNAIKTLSHKNCTFKILSLNCQSLQAKYEQIKLYLQIYKNANIEFNAICLQETWLGEDYDTSLLHMDGYTLVSKGKKVSSHGGVAIYLKSNITYEILDIEGNSEIWDGIFIKVSVTNNFGKEKYLIIGNIYRPPRDNIQNLKTFNIELDEILTRLQHSKCEALITGDFNLDLLKIKIKTSTNDFLDTFISNGFLPKITLPTRMGTNNKGSLIDNVFVKLSNNFSSCTSGILRNNMSDHYPYFVSLDYLHQKSDSTRYIKIRNTSPRSYTNFKNEIQALCSNLVLPNTNDPNNNYNILSDTIEKTYQKHFPCKSVRFQKYKHKKEKWITMGILKSIKYRDKLYSNLRNLEANSKEYFDGKINLRTYNRILKQCIRERKRMYYRQCFEKFKNDMKQTWTIIKTVMNKKNNTSPFPEFFIVDNLKITDSNEIAEHFNRFFTNIGPELAAKIDMPPNKSYTHYLKKTFQHTLTFEKVKKEDIIKIIENLKPKTSSGIDNISNKLLKLINYEIAEPLTCIVNQILETGIFPEKLKLAKVIPVYKKDEKFKLNNYRPISVLPSMSKVVERVIHQQLHSYFDKHKLYFQGQYGFRKDHNTELALLELIDRLTKTIDNGEIPINIYLDLSKAFDTLDHRILLHKLHYYGIRNTALALFESYLSHRYQYVNYNDNISNELLIKTGVPQGSILGPLLFLIYINDLPKCSNVFELVTYADDTTLFTTLKALIDCSDENVNVNIKNELCKITNWLKLNKLSLNLNKTKAMVFHLPQRRDVFTPFIEMSGRQIELVNEFSFLGITVDKHINWKCHIDNICKKVSKTTGIMNRLKNTLPRNILLTLYNSLVLPHLTYGILAWGASNTNDLLKLQKKAVRIITNSRYNAHADPLFKDLQLLKLKDLCTLNELRFCYKYEKSLLPKYFQQGYITKNLDIHDHDTIHSEEYRTPMIRTEFAKKNLHFRIVSTFNKCDSNIKSKIDTHSLGWYLGCIKKEMISRYKLDCTKPDCPSCNARPQ